MAETAKKPAIRFKGFTGVWEQRKLRNIADKVTEKNADLAVLETFTNSAEFGIISQRDFFDHDISNAENIGGYYVVKNEDFVYNPRISVTAPVGPINRNKLGRNGVMSPLYTVFRTHDIDTTYLEWFFKSASWHDFMHYNGDSGARSDRFSIKDAVFFEMSIPYPEIAEQRKIGRYLDQLDNLITLHQRKYDKLVNVKKSCLEKMFPKNGSNVPEIRFSGFTEAWEQRKFGDISEIKTGPFGSTLHAGDYVTDGVPIITTEHFKTGTLQNDKEGLPQVSQEDYERLLSYVLNDGDVVFSRVGSVDVNALITPFQDGWLFSGRVLRVRPSRGSDSQFLHTLLETEDVKNDIRARAVGQTMPSINTEILKATILLLPTSETEQRQIGACFRQLDHLITLHQRELEKLQNLKKACLEKMFV